jgi:hypothetical protein
VRPGVICYLAIFGDAEYGITCRAATLKPASTRIFAARTRLGEGRIASELVCRDDGEALSAHAATPEDAAKQICDVLRAAYGYRLVTIHRDEEIQQRSARMGH